MTAGAACNLRTDVQASSRPASRGKAVARSQEQLQAVAVLHKALRDATEALTRARKNAQSTLPVEAEARRRLQMWIADCPVPSQQPDGRTRAALTE